MSEGLYIITRSHNEEMIMHSEDTLRRGALTTALLLLLSLCGVGCKESAPAGDTTGAAARTSLSISAGGKFDDPAPGSLTSQPLHALLEVEKRHPLEASGLAFLQEDEEPETLKGSDILAVFDHFSTAAVVPRDLQSGATFLGGEESDFGYEGVTFDGRTQRFYALVEAVERKKRFEPEIHVYDTSWQLVAEQQVDFEVEDFNKGMEGLAHVYHEDTLYLLQILNCVP